MKGEFYAFYMWCWLGVFVLIFFTFLVQVYFSYSKVNEILECLGQSNSVLGRQFLLGDGVFSRSFFVLSIAGMLVFPETHIKGGGFTREEFEGVPYRLRFKLKALVYVLFVLVGVCIALLCMGEYMGWLNEHS
ncbi:hypothetical protein [Pseudomonas sp. MF6747]|uniref:hypothetical protein n=1 Tax=Pseudomonas sp. MF6747 TaxID=2797527 RepID=UPI00190CE90C|nr:hypothetical protein [Pseudomonas sp. MF6747]MBK3507957.1 hypothetical protein [Pseudomonas sp. MF6747]